jgi:hypothetical protein
MIDIAVFLLTAYIAYVNAGSLTGILFTLAMLLFGASVIYGLLNFKNNVPKINK